MLKTTKKKLIWLLFERKKLFFYSKIHSGFADADVKHHTVSADCLSVCDVGVFWFDTVMSLR